MAAIRCWASKALGTVALVLVLNGATMSASSAFDLEAHRGGRALFPENTLASFANALSMGVNTLELDIGVTRDSAIIVSHERKLNPDLARGPDGSYVAPPGTPFVQLSLDQVKQYDVGRIRPGSAYAAQFPDQRVVPGTRIPTLIEVFDLVRRSRDSLVRFNIETKIDPNHPDESPDPQRFVELLLGLLHSEEMADRVTVQSFDWRTLLLVQQLEPSIPTVYLTQQKGFGATVSPDKATEWTAAFNPADYGRSIPGAIKAAGGAIWSPYFGDIDAEAVTEAHRLGLKVVVWTVNKPDDIARMIDLGADGVISDRPDILRKVADEKKIALPLGHPVTP